MNIKAPNINIGFNRFVERRNPDRLPVDVYLLISVIILICIGLVMMTSASISEAARVYQDPFYFFEKQIFYVLAGLIAGVVVWKIPLGVIDKARPFLLVTSILLLAILLIPGVGQTVNGSTRWIRLGSINFQVSELVKLLMILFFAGYLQKHRDALMASSKPVLVPLGILSLIGGLLLVQPDFGATVVISVTIMSMLLLAGVRLRIFALLAVAGSALFALLIYTSPYRFKRLTGFLDPWADPFNTGFQLSQSLIAFGRGEWFGVGLGESVQKLFYLPEAHTDFVFAVIAEELGVVGAIFVIALFTFISWRALRIGKQAERNGHMFSAYMAYGIGCWLAFQAYVNVGVNMGVLPTKGLTLPLISYGGSSMVISCMAMALLLRADYELRFQFREKDKERRAI